MSFIANGPGRPDYGTEDRCESSRAAMGHEHYVAGMVITNTWPPRVIADRLTTNDDGSPIEARNCDECGADVRAGEHRDALEWEGLMARWNRKHRK